MTIDRTSSFLTTPSGENIQRARIGIVFAAREPEEELRQFPDLEVRGLRSGDARALLSSAMPFMFDEPVRERIIAETRQYLDDADREHRCRQYAAANFDGPK